MNPPEPPKLHPAGRDVWSGATAADGGPGTKFVFVTGDAGSQPNLKPKPYDVGRNAAKRKRRSDRRNNGPR